LEPPLVVEDSELFLEKSQQNRKKKLLIFRDNRVRVCRPPVFWELHMVWESVVWLVGEIGSRKVLEKK
jgi:hypothetical protein